MKRILFILALLYVSGACGQIVVDTTFTVQELVEDVLVNSECARTSNYSSFTGTNFGFNGIGYFNANSSSFLFREGIVLSTGNAVDAEGPNDDIVSSGVEFWRADEDLRDITNTSSLFNATFIQFDFIPTSNRLSFNFLFASEEYSDGFQCSFSDVFAFILTDSRGDSSNLAIIPGTNDPVRVTSVRPGVPGSCGPENQEFFGSINGIASPIAYTGQTTRLQASSDVNPGETYTIKLVIADNLDTQLDSAVFLEAGSFSTAISLGQNRTVDGGNPLCIGESVPLDATSPGATEYTWYRDGIELTGFRNDTNIVATDSGLYEVEVAFSDICVVQGAVRLEFVPPPSIATPPEDLVLCDIDGDGKEPFNFSENGALILGSLDPDIYQVTYFLTQRDAEAFENRISRPTAFMNTAPSETIYARLSSGESCFEIATFQITTERLVLNSTLEETYILCLDALDVPQSPLPVLNTSLSETDFRFIWFRDAVSNVNQIIGETGNQITVDSPGIYIAEVTNIAFGCSFLLTTEVIPVAPPTRFEVEVISDFFVETSVVQIVVEGNSEYLFSVDGGNFTSNNRFENLLGGEHIAEVMDIEGCSTVLMRFEVVDYPRFFTPNGDGANDLWGIGGIAELENPQVTIYDRFGRLLEQLDPDELWDGTFSGRDMPSSDYWFRIVYERDAQQKVFRGHFALKR